MQKRTSGLEITWIVYWWKRWSQDLLLVDRVSLEMLKFRPVGPQGTLREIINPKVQIMSGLQWLKGCKGQVICMVTLRQNAFIVCKLSNGYQYAIFMTFIWVSYDTQVHLISVKCILSLLVFRYKFVFWYLIFFYPYLHFLIIF